MTKLKKKPIRPVPLGNLYTTALALAQDRTLEELARESGLPFYWLRRFRAGKITNPSVNRIEILLNTYGAL